MPFTIVRNDITNMKVDVIVNTANPKPIIGSGVDSTIHEKAGPKLLKARVKIGDIAIGDAAMTSAYDLDAKYVIHTVGPVWRGGSNGEIESLKNCYESALCLAAKKRCRSIAFPLISSGNYGFPKGRALETAISVISHFLLEQEMQVYLVVFDRKSYSLSEQLFSAVESYIDENYVTEAKLHAGSLPLQRFLRETRSVEEAACSESKPLLAFHRKLEDVVKEVDDSFSKNLLHLIDQKGLTDPQVYKKANIDRKLFSKIRINENYKPSKMTALALAIALELNLDETKDFIGRAGYALTHSSLFDIIVEYFIVNENYDIFELNAVLFEFDQPVMGG